MKILIIISILFLTVLPVNATLTKEQKLQLCPNYDTLEERMNKLHGLKRDFNKKEEQLLDDFAYCNGWLPAPYNPTIPVTRYVPIFIPWNY
jgi:hypothetical protein